MKCDIEQFTELYKLPIDMLRRYPHYMFYLLSHMYKLHNSNIMTPFISLLLVTSTSIPNLMLLITKFEECTYLVFG